MILINFIKPIIIVGIRIGNIIGWGEACPGRYYGDSLEKERKKASPEELKLIEEEINPKKVSEESAPETKTEKEIITEKTIIPRRIP